MRKSLTFLTLFSLTTFALQAQSGLQMSLTECIQYAETHNISVQSSQLDVQTTDIQLKQTRLQMAPTVSANIGQRFGYSHQAKSFALNGDYSLNAAVDIFNGLNTYHSIKQQQLQLSQAQLQVEQAKNQVRIQIIRSFLTILMNQEMEISYANLLTSSRQQVEEGAKKFQVGQILESDFLMLKAQYLSDSINYENTRLSIDNEYVTLRTLLHLPRTESLQIVAPDSSQLAQALTVPSLETILAQTLDYLPELKIKETAVDVAEYDVKIAKSSYYPTLSASAGIGTDYHAAYGQQQKGLVSGLYDGLAENIGLNLSIPIYQRGKARNSVKIKNLQVQQAELALQSSRDAVTQEIESYHLDLQKAFNDFTLTEQQKSAYYANYMAYMQMFQYGSITTVDLLQQQTNYLNILSSFMQNKYNFLMQIKVLDVYTGKAVTF